MILDEAHNESELVTPSKSVQKGGMITFDVYFFRWCRYQQTILDKLRKDGDESPSKLSGLQEISADVEASDDQIDSEEEEEGMLVLSF